jgi:hypothetical protein
LACASAVGQPEGSNKQTSKEQCMLTRQDRSHQGKVKFVKATESIKTLILPVGRTNTFLKENYYSMLF